MKAGTLRASVAFSDFSSFSRYYKIQLPCEVVFRRFFEAQEGILSRSKDGRAALYI